ncbi:MAG TPA: hypothetical protein VG942_07535 [Hyphomonadaceae bacterium]|nr:hypothetical protein [Hyphomonadaceae bacterium]
MVVLSSSALGRRLSSALAAVAVLGVSAVALAPAALAQKSPPAGQAAGQQVSKELVGPLTEARTAIIAKDWATAKTKLDAAAPLAKTPQDNLSISQLRLNVAAGTNDAPGKIAAMEAGLATNLLSPDDTKRYKAGLLTAYQESGNTAKYLELSRGFLDQYGGTHGQYASLAQDSLKAGDNAGALALIAKAIDGAKAEGKVPEAYYRIKVRAAVAGNDSAKYFEGLGSLISDYPNDNYWKELITKAQEQPSYKANAGDVRLDVYRALVAAGVKLTPAEASSMAVEASRRGLPNEIVMVMTPMAAELGPDQKKQLDDASGKIKADKAALPAQEKDFANKPDALAQLGEAYISYGDYAKAVELIQTALTKGISDPGKADVARLHLGIAQLKAGQKDAAIATFGQVKSDNGTFILAKAWVLIAAKPAA